ncbi:acyltransferase [Aeromicrobium sp. P5_D10]
MKNVLRVVVRAFVNSVVAAQLMPRGLRYRILRAWGVDTRSKEIHPRFIFSSPNVSIGENTTINWCVLFEAGARITIGANCGIGFYSQLITTTHDVGPSGRRMGAERSLPITIGDGTWVGVNVIIQPGVTIGEGCIIGAGSVVTTDCAPNGFYAGAPARRVKDLSD